MQRMLPIVYPHNEDSIMTLASDYRIAGTDAEAMAARIALTHAVQRTFEEMRRLEKMVYGR